MFGATASYWLGFSRGQTAAERQQDLDWAADAFFGRGRPVAVDQSYIKALHADAQGARDRSRYNADLARQWIAYAKSLKTQVNSLKSQLADHQRIAAERNGLDMFMNLASFLLKAQAAGKASRPEFAELRTIALEIAAIHNRGDVFGGSGGQPEKLARFEKLWDDLI